ncbi:MAG: hypothetical protein E7317_00665 [Clostridiales bacterium]|nr:hypothetical protein [Clostridiales bacterium]
MSKKADSRVLRYMLMRTVAPSMLIILIATLFFAFFRMTALRSNAALQRQNRTERLEAGFAALEGTLNDIDMEQRRLLNSTTLRTLVNMYDDIDWYRRYALQTELRDSLSALYNRYDGILDGAYLYLPSTGRHHARLRDLAVARGGGAAAVAFGRGAARQPGMADQPQPRGICRGSPRHGGRRCAGHVYRRGEPAAHAGRLPPDLRRPP